MTIFSALVGLNQRVAEPLMVTLSMIMTNEFGHGTPQRTLSEEDHPIQALRLD